MDLPKNENSSVQYGLRPCVIMSNQKAINSSTVLNVLPITSKNKRCNKLHIPVSRECGLKLDSIVLAEQILTVSKNLIKNKIGKVGYVFGPTKKPYVSIRLFKSANRKRIQENSGEKLFVSKAKSKKPNKRRMRPRHKK